MKTRLLVILPIISTVIILGIVWYTTGFETNDTGLYPTTDHRGFCLMYGGTWDIFNNECLPMRSLSCEDVGGVHVECAKCVSNTCLDICISACQLKPNSTGSVFDQQSTDAPPQYLGKTLSEWREYSFDELYQISKTDKNFHKELSRMAIKDHMKNQLALNNITNTNDDFMVFSGWWQSNSLGFNSVINSTDGKSYLVLGSAAYHSIGDYFEIRELKFDYDMYDKNNFYFSDDSAINISPDPNNPSRVSDYDVIIDLNQTNKVTFQNNLPTIIRIQENGPGDVDEQKNLKWVGPTILPGMQGDVTFENTGHYEWNAREPLPFANVWPMKGSGEISVIGSDTDSLPLKARLKIAQSFAKLSGVPWSGLGASESSLDVDLYASVYEMIPDAKNYYTQQLEEIIPFDVLITLEEPDY